MSSPITLSGFNSIDFSVIVDAILAQERLPIANLEQSRTDQEKRKSAYGILESRLSSIDSAATALTAGGSFQSFTATPADDTILSASAGVGAGAGSHTINVTALAKAQVLASESTVASIDDVVADDGTLTIGGRNYTATGATTLAELRDQINADSDAVAKASLVDTGSGFKLVLTAKDTGTAGAFTVQNNLTLTSGGPPLVTFTDTDGDNESGDSAADNAVSAVDAQLTIDGIAITRSTNTIEGALAGVDLTLKSLGTTTLEVDPDNTSVKDKLQTFVTAYNDLSHYLQSQIAAGAAGPLAGDSIARSASSEIRNILRATIDTGGGAFDNLVEIGITFDRSGDLQIDEALLDEALTDNPDDVEALFESLGTGDGVVTRLENTIDRYLGSSGLLASVDQRVDEAIGSLTRRIESMEERLLLREQELIQQFTFADQSISSLNTQGDSLASLGQLF